MNAKKQYGKGLSGFFVGLLLATSVIAGVLFFLNKNGKSSVKELPQAEEKAPQPEILTPSKSASGGLASSAASKTAAASAASPITASSGMSAASSPAVGEADKNPPPATPAEQPAKPALPADDGMADQTLPPAVLPVPAPKHPAEPAHVAKEAARKQALAKKQTELKKAQAEEYAKQPRTKAKSEANSEPTPEQILDSGSLDKARKAARNEASRKSSTNEAERKRAEDALNGRIGADERQSSKPSAHAAKAKPEDSQNQGGGKVVLQVGSYNNQQAADVQRSKLTMAGVSASVVQAEVNGKPVYRVQTGVLSAAEAAAARQKLQQRGISSFTRSAQ